MRLGTKTALIGAASVLLLANVGVRIATATETLNGRCTLTENPIPGQPSTCGCAWLTSPTNCDALPGSQNKCKLSSGECLPE